MAKHVYHIEIEYTDLRQFHPISVTVTRHAKVVDEFYGKKLRPLLNKAVIAIHETETDEGTPTT